MENQTISLVGIKHAFGERVIENREIEEKYDLPEGWILDKTGKEKGYAWNSGPEAPIKASLKCLEEFLAEVAVDKTKIKAVFGTTNPITIDGVNLPSLTRTFAEKAGLGGGKVSDEGYGCGGSAIGVNSMYKWLKGQPDNTYAVYVTQDWSTKMVKQRNVEALFSDAVSVSLWTNGWGGVAEVVGIFSEDTNISEESLGIVNGFWEMDGKEVSRQASEVPALVAERLHLDLRDYIIVPHQPNAKLLETVEKIYGIELYKEVARKYGNPTCSGALIALEELLNGQREINKDVLVIPFGAGGVGAFVLRKQF